MGAKVSHHCPQRRAFISEWAGRSPSWSPRGISSLNWINQWSILWWRAVSGMHRAAKKRSPMDTRAQAIAHGPLRTCRILAASGQTDHSQNCSVRCRRLPAIGVEIESKRSRTVTIGVRKNALDTFAAPVSLWTLPRVATIARLGVCQRSPFQRLAAEAVQAHEKSTLDPRCSPRSKGSCCPRGRIDGGLGHD